MDTESSLAFLGRFRSDDIAVPWIQPFVQMLAVISAEEPEVAPEGKTLINFRRNLRLSKVVHMYLQFQKQSDHEAAEDGRRLADLVWSSPEMPLAKLQQLADELSSQTPRWKGSRSPRSKNNADQQAVEAPPTLGRRKSNNNPTLPPSPRNE